MLRSYRQRGFNQKRVVIIGSGALARRYLNQILEDKELGYSAVGYISEKKTTMPGKIKYLGDYNDLAEVLEVISAIETADYGRTPKIIADCDKAGVKLSIIPFYAEYMSSRPQFDDLNGLPLLNVRRIPLDNLANAFLKRAMDIILSALMLISFPPSASAFPRRGR